MSMVLTPRIISVFLVSAILLNRVTSAVHFTYVKKIYVCVCVQRRFDRRWTKNSTKRDDGFASDQPKDGLAGWEDLV